MPPGLPFCEARMFHSRLREAAWGKTAYHPMNQPSHWIQHLQSLRSRPRLGLQRAARREGEAGCQEKSLVLSAWVTGRMTLMTGVDWWCAWQGLACPSVSPWGWEITASQGQAPRVSGCTSRVHRQPPLLLSPPRCPPSPLTLSQISPALPSEVRLVLSHFQGSALLSAPNSNHCQSWWPLPSHVEINSLGG